MVAQHPNLVAEATDMVALVPNLAAMARDMVVPYPNLEDVASGMVAQLPNLEDVALDMVAQHPIRGLRVVQHPAMASDTVALLPNLVAIAAVIKSLAVASISNRVPSAKAQTLVFVSTVAEVATAADLVATAADAVATVPEVASDTPVVALAEDHSPVTLPRMLLATKSTDMLGPGPKSLGFYERCDLILYFALTNNLH